MYFQSLVQLFVHHGLLIKSWTNSTASLQSQYTIAFNAGWLWLGFFSTTFMFASPRLQELTKWHLGAKGLHSSEIFRAFYPLHITKLPSDHPFPLLLVRTLKQFWGMNWWHTFCTYFPEVMSEPWHYVGTTGFLAVMNHMMWWQWCDFCSIWQKTGQISQIATQFTVDPVKRIMMEISHIQSMRGFFFLHISITLIQPTRDVTSI